MLRPLCDHYPLSILFDYFNSTCDDGHGRAHFHPFLCRDADKETQQKCLNEEVPSWAAEVLAHVSSIQCFDLWIIISTIIFNYCVRSYFSVKVLNFNVLVISEKHVPNCDQNCILPSTISKQWDQNSTKVSVHHSLKLSVISLTLKVIVKNINLYCSQIWISFETILLYFITLENRFNMIYDII